MASWARVAIEIESGDELKVLDRIERLADEQDKICEQGAALFLSCETRGSGSGEVRIEQRWARKHRSLQTKTVSYKYRSYPTHARELVSNVWQRSKGECEKGRRRGEDKRRRIEPKLTRRG